MVTEDNKNKQEALNLFSALIDDVQKDSDSRFASALSALETLQRSRDLTGDEHLLLGLYKIERDRRNKEYANTTEDSSSKANNGQAGRELQVLEEFGDSGGVVFDSYKARITVHHSSAAFAPHMWLRTEGGGIVDSGGTNKGSAHLNIEQARWVRDRLTKWIEETEEDYTKAAAGETSPYLGL